MDAAQADGGVADVDDLVPGGFQACEGGADGDGLAGADLAGDDAHLPLGHAPLGAGDCLAVRWMQVQALGRDVPAEGHPRETVMGLQSVNTHVVASFSVVVMWSKLMGEPVMESLCRCSIRRR